MASITQQLRLVITGDSAGAVRALDSVGLAADKSLLKTQTAAEKNRANMTKWGATGMVASAMVGAALVKAAGAYENLAIAAGKFAVISGMTTEAASRFVNVAGDLGVTGEDLSSAIGRMGKNFQTSEAKLNAFGFAMERANDGTYDAQGTFLGVIERLRGMADASERAEAATAIFGRGWQTIVPLISAGAQQISSELAGVADNIVFSEAQVASAKAYRASIEDMKDSLQGLVVSVGQGAAPIISTLAGIVETAASAFGKLDSVTGGFAGKAAALGVVVLGVGSAVSFTMGKFQAMQASLTASGGSIGLAVAAFAMLTQIMGSAGRSQKDAKAQADAYTAAITSQADGVKDAAAAEALKAVSTDKMSAALKGSGLSTQQAAQFILGYSDELGKAGEIIYATSNGAIVTLEDKLVEQRKAFVKAGEAARQHAADLRDLLPPTSGLLGPTKANAENVNAFGVALIRPTDKMRDWARSQNIAARSSELWAEKTEAAFDGVFAHVDGLVNLDHALQTVKDKEEALALVLADKKSSLLDIKTANDELTQSHLEAAQALATQNTLGQTFATVAEKDAAQAGIMVSALEKVLATAKKGSPLYIALQVLIAQLEAISGDHTGRVIITGMPGIPLDTYGGGMPGIPVKGKRAAGGPVSNGTYLVGEKGPELLNIGGSGNVIPNSALGNGGSPITINVVAPSGSDPYTFGQAVVRAIKAYEQANGKVFAAA